MSHDPMVDAGPAMEHIRALYGKGMRLSAMAEHTFVKESTLRSMFDGYRIRKGARLPVRRCSRSRLEAILAIPYEPPLLPGKFCGRKLRFIREARGLSRRALCNLAGGLNESTLIYWENGRSAPMRGGKLQAVLSVLAASPGDVCEGGEEPEPEMEDFDAYIGGPSVEEDYISPYPCMVCGQPFRSRLLLATHAHPKKVRV